MKIALGIAYDGSCFSGWQTQPSGVGVQDHLERALGEIAGHPVRLVAAGRTDAGVHAAAQVAHFETDSDRPASAWVRGTNANLPEAVAVQWAVPVASEFHARFSAAGRSYRYVLYNHPVRPALAARSVGWFHVPLDLEAMRDAASRIVGRHDFSAFRAAECQARTPVRTLAHATVVRRGPYVLFDFRADAFLHHMVRNIVGSLVYVGKGRHSPAWIGEVLASRDRATAAPTFAAGGLYLSAVHYPAEWTFPAFAPMMPLFDLPAESA